jgi:hypothetical protein
MKHVKDMIRKRKKVSFVHLTSYTELLRQLTILLGQSQDRVQIKQYLKGIRVGNTWEQQPYNSAAAIMLTAITETTAA